MTDVPRIDREQPDALRDVLVDAGLFLVAYELIRSLVVNPIESFYAHTTFAPGMPFADFSTDVSRRSRHRFDACLLWLRDHMQAITDDQYSAIHRIRDYRDKLAHGIHENICKHDFAEATTLLIAAKDALFALDNFWTRMHIQADPEFAHVTDWSEVYSNAFAMLDKLLKTVRPSG